MSGPNAARSAAELRAVLAANAGPGDEVSPVEVRRSAELVIAVIGLVFGGVGAAKTIWDWWHSRRPDGVAVTVLLSDGTRVELSNASSGELKIAFQQVESRQAEDGDQRG
ncbi:effector-associated constant component EACC1 [Micromonospora sonchi]|uniref:effector-associated constant component EACC1 n=1 Tax=Micromonospora sonchi TaxID=1763543 RepID=UPI003571271B